MGATRVWTATELLKLTPLEQAAALEASVVRDLEQLPPELLARACARIGQRIAQADSLRR